MIEENHATQNTNETENGQSNNDFEGLGGILVAGAWAFVGLLLAAIFWPNLSERIKFFTGNLWNLVIAFAVIAQVVVYLRQSRLMARQLKEIKNQSSLAKESIKMAEKSSIYAQRAYVVAKIRDVGKGDDTLQFRLRIQNGGNTPANNVSVSYTCELRESPPWKMLSKPFSEMPVKQVLWDSGFDQHERLGVIAPNGSYFVVPTPETSFQSTAEYQAFELGTLKFYCWGRIEYETMFNEPRHTDFCFYQSQKRPEGYPCEHGNQAI